MSNTAVGNTTFVLGKNADGNKESRTYEDGQEYDLPISLLKGYTTNEATFPHPA